MDFARKQMERMGWKPGRGLGKKEDGISKALKPQSQQDSCGLGYDRTQSFNTQIWFAKIDSAIREARNGRKKRKRLVEDVDEEENDKQDDINDVAEEVEEEATGTDSRFYSQFTKPQIMLNTSLAPVEEKEEKEQEPEPEPKKEKRGKKRTFMDLDRVFRETKGVTCHRSAHTGVKMTGKMKRLMEQEEEFR